jgi:phosphoribosylformimino-5-aminoimidazole carboxamide ribonucleotide (ProFAR) isomerase
MCDSFGLVAVTNCIQDMLYIRNVLESIGLKNKVDLDNKGAKDIINNWSVGGHMRLMGVKFNFLRELKESGVTEIHWISTHDNCLDILKPLDSINLYRSM